MDHKNYDTYITFFDDTSGLDVRGDVKTSGVRIGWVENIHLREGGKAEVHLKINKAYKLALNAYAIIQQESLLGAKIVEVDQGDFATGTLVPGATLAMPGKSSTSIGDLVDSFRDIAQNVGDIAHSFRNVFASKKGQKNLEKTLDNAAKAAENIASLADKIDRTVDKKEGLINGAIDDIAGTARSLNDGVPKITAAISETAAELRSTVLPALAKAGPALESFEDASAHAREGFREAEQVMEKINTGKGLIGKLVTEDETYDDLKKTIHGLKEYVSRMQSLRLYVDMHTENLFKRNLNKGYLDIKIRPSTDYFYQFQVMTDEHGRVHRRELDVSRYDSNGDLIPRTDLSNYQAGHIPEKTVYEERIKNTYDFGFQFGKRFNRLALRVGLIDGTVGAGVDYYVPLKTDAVHWMSTLELFDMRGVRRSNDKRPHLKWLNKVYFMKNLYSTFGFDDIMSRQSASPFFGMGLRFTDADLKYFFSMFSGMAATKS